MIILIITKGHKKTCVAEIVVRQSSDQSRAFK
jgi:hypothetical protein